MLRLTALSGIYLLLFTIQQVLRWKYGWTTLGHKIIQKNYLLNILYFLKNNNLTSLSGRFLVFLIYFFIGPISYQKSSLKFWMSISRSKDCWRSYICIPSGAQTHIIAHTKGRPWARLSNPFLCRKTVLKTIKSFSISD